jgi:hypothetical protein
MQIEDFPLPFIISFYFYPNHRLKGKLPDDVKERDKSHFCFFSSEGFIWLEVACRHSGIKAVKLPKRTSAERSIQ